MLKGVRDQKGGHSLLKNSQFPFQFFVSFSKSVHLKTNSLSLPIWEKGEQGRLGWTHSTLILRIGFPCIRVSRPLSHRILQKTFQTMCSKQCLAQNSLRNYFKIESILASSITFQLTSLLYGNSHFNKLYYNSYIYRNMKTCILRVWRVKGSSFWGQDNGLWSLKEPDFVL